MASTNINIKVDSDILKQAQIIFDELGIDLSTAINLFLIEVVKENGLPFDVPNDKTMAAIKEGNRIATDKKVKGYKTIEELKKGLNL